MIWENGRVETFVGAMRDRAKSGRSAAFCSERRDFMLAEDCYSRWQVRGTEVMDLKAQHVPARVLQDDESLTAQNIACAKTSSSAPLQS